jgi:hypothetical protein
MAKDVAFFALFVSLFSSCCLAVGAYQLYYNLQSGIKHLPHGHIFAASENLYW